MKARMLRIAFFMESGLAPVANTGPDHPLRTLVSTSRPLIHTVTSWPLEANSEATANPGKEWPPVPPHATINFMAKGFSCYEMTATG